MALNDGVHWHDSRMSKESAKQGEDDGKRRNSMAHRDIRFTELFRSGFGEYDIS